MYHRRTQPFLPYIAAAAVAWLIVATNSAAARAQDWASGISAFVFDPPRDDAFGLGIFTADRSTLHLEARYNYENLETGSAFVGWNFAGDGEVAWTATPVLGLVFGETDGAAPGVEADFLWRVFELYVESEYVIDFESRDENFLYGWVEATGSPADWARLGLAAQRTRSYQTDLDVQRGIMLEGTRAAWSLGVYWFNLDRSDDDLFAFALSYQM